MCPNSVNSTTGDNIQNTSKPVAGFFKVCQGPHIYWVAGAIAPPPTFSKIGYFCTDMEFPVRLLEMNQQQREKATHNTNICVKIYH